MENESRNSQDGMVNRAAQIAGTPGGRAPGNGGNGSSTSFGSARGNANGRAGGLGALSIDVAKAVGSGAAGDPIHTQFPFILGEDVLGDTSTYLVVQGDPSISFTF